MMSDTIAADLRREIEPSRTELLKDALRPLYAAYRRREQRRRVRRLLAIAPELGCTDYFVDEGLYRTALLLRAADRLYRLRGKTMAVAGCGYGRHLYTVAKVLRPRLVHAIDPYPHEAWDGVRQRIRADLDVPVVFHTGDLKDVAPQLGTAALDAVLSDAVLEHVRDLDTFLAAAHQLLRPGGAFYASLGPLWFSPGGDHQDWGPGHEYDHIALSPEEYAAKWRQVDTGRAAYATEASFMYAHRLFSYLRPREYVELFRRHFVVDQLWLGVHHRALQLAARRDPLYLALAERHGQLDISVKAIFVFMRRDPGG